MKARAIFAIALVGLMVGSILAVMPEASAKELSEKSSTIYLHCDGGAFYMNLNKAAEGEESMSFQTEGEFDCPLTPALNTTVNLNTESEGKFEFSISTSYFFGLAPLGYDWTVDVEYRLTAGSKEIASGSGTQTFDFMGANMGTFETVVCPLKPVVSSFSAEDGNLNLHFKVVVSGTNEGSMFVAGQGSYGSSLLKLPILSVGTQTNETADGSGNETDGNVTDGGDAGTQGGEKTPGFETIAIISAVGAVALLSRRRKC